MSKRKRGISQKAQCKIRSATPAEVFAIASNSFRGLIISSAVVLIAMFYWFSSVSKNKIPTWLQIALPLSLPIIYIVIEVITKPVLHLNLGTSWGLVVIALITVIVSLLVNLKEQNSLSMPPTNLPKATTVRATVKNRHCTTQSAT